MKPAALFVVEKNEGRGPSNVQEGLERARLLVRDERCGSFW
jgi:hypothetical protein